MCIVLLKSAEGVLVEISYAAASHSITLHDALTFCSDEELVLPVTFVKASTLKRTVESLELLVILLVL